MSRRSASEWPKEAGVAAVTCHRSKATTPSATAKKGASSSKSRQVTRPLCHQCRITSAAGSVTTMFLASIPAASSNNARQ